MKLSLSEAIVVAKKLLTGEAGFDIVRVSSVVAVEGESNLKVVADIGLRQATGRR